jgi:IS30 family transposase
VLHSDQIFATEPAALPYHARRSFTFDRGSEFMGYRVLEDGMGPEAGFAIQIHPGKKVLLRTSTSAFDVTYPATLT